MTFKNRRVLLPAVMLTAAAAMTVSSVAVAATGCFTSTKKCDVDVLVSGTAVTFDPDVAHVKQSELKKQYKITFHLPKTGYKFLKGDGVVFKDPVNGEFFGCGVLTMTGKKKWRCTYKNTVLGKYRYKVTFHDTAGNPLVGDPLITNIDTH